MEDQIKERAKALKKKRRNRSIFPVVIASVIIISVAGGYYLYQNHQGQEAESKQPQQLTEVESSVSQPERIEPQPQADADIRHGEPNDPIGDIISSSQLDSQTEQPPQPSFSEQVAQPAAQPVTEPEVQQDMYQAAVDRIKHFYSALDQKRYIQQYQFDSPSVTYFSTLTQKALDNPPIVTGETDDLFNILKNTAHFFRIVGKKNIIIIKSILHEEKTSYERVLADYYLLIEKPEFLEQEFALQVSDKALLDYAGFFLNTMGGRLYLFRRDSVSRILVSYYSILIVEQANQEARNTYGIDIKPAVDSLIEELESSNVQLQLKERYLDTLYTLQEKY